MNSYEISTVLQLLAAIGNHMAIAANPDWPRLGIIVEDTTAVSKRYTIRRVVHERDELILEVRPENVLTEQDVPF